MADSSSTTTAPPPTSQAQSQVALPRITITFCTQCKWLLRAAWLQQELLSTFSTTLGEVALVPATGGVFRIGILHADETSDAGVRETLLWDRKAEGGFPEAKVLKQRVRDCVDPARALGHSDSAERKGTPPDLAGKVREGGPRNPLVGRMRGEGGGGEKEKECEDCA